MAIESVIPYMLKAWVITAVMMLILWCVQVKYKNAGYVDLGWALGLALAALFYAVSADGWIPRRILIASMVSIWAGRLIFLLIRRLQRDPSEDARYRRIRESWKTGQNFKFFLMFQFQSLLDIILSLGFILVCLDGMVGLSIFEILGMMLWLGGLIGETVADIQLKDFKSDSMHKGKTCDVGLWRYSRHPNYFFEWTIWIGYAVFALGSPWGWTAVSAPILMLYFLLKVSGIPLVEAQSLKNRGEEYRRYQASTSIFIPLPKRTI